MGLLSKDWEGHRYRSQDQDGWLNLRKLYFSKKLLTVALNLSLVVRKPVFGVTDQVPQKPVCTATEDG